MLHPCEEAQALLVQCQWNAARGTGRTRARSQQPAGRLNREREPPPPPPPTTGKDLPGPATTSGPAYPPQPSITNPIYPARSKQANQTCLIPLPPRQPTGQTHKATDSIYQPTNLHYRPPSCLNELDKSFFHLSIPLRASSLRLAVQGTHPPNHSSQQRRIRPLLLASSQRQPRQQQHLLLADGRTGHSARHRRLVTRCTHACLP